MTFNLKHSSDARETQPSHPNAPRAQTRRKAPGALARAEAAATFFDVPRCLEDGAALWVDPTLRAWVCPRCARSGTCERVGGKDVRVVGRMGA